MSTPTYKKRKYNIPNNGRRFNPTPMLFRLFPDTEAWVREYAFREGLTISATGEKAFRLLMAYEEAMRR